MAWYFSGEYKMDTPIPKINTAKKTKGSETPLNSNFPFNLHIKYVRGRREANKINVAFPSNPPRKNGGIASTKEKIKMISKLGRLSIVRFSVILFTT